MKKIWEKICSIIEIIKEIGILIFIIIKAKDPCKKCIVKACCTEKCEERIYLENFILQGDTIFHAKFTVWFIIIYIPSILIIVIYNTIKTFF